MTLPPKPKHCFDSLLFHKHPRVKIYMLVLMKESFKQAPSYHTFWQMEHFGIKFWAGFQSLPRIDGSDKKKESDVVVFRVKLVLSSATNEPDLYRWKWIKKWLKMVRFLDLITILLPQKLPNQNQNLFPNLILQNMKNRHQFESEAFLTLYF